MPNQQPNQETLPRLAETFTYRYNWIRQDKGTHWRTIKKQLSDNELINLYQSPSAIIGVGFGKETSYLILDIDRSSPYHPSQDADAINTIKHILSQELGLEESIIIQSSYSEGIHLYYPLPEPVKSYCLGKVVTETLEVHGYQVKGGQLEVFPNKKKGGYTKDKKQWTVYNRIRLPLQPNSGSWILDDDFNPLVGLDSEGRLKAESLEQFWWLWDKAAACQDIEQLTLVLENNKQTNSFSQKRFFSKGKYQYKSSAMRAIERDLQEQIEGGFTGDAQTNDLLLDLGRRLRIVERIGDSALRDRLLEIVTAMPGYSQYCGHLKDIWQRCQDVARWATKMFYIIGEKKSQPLPELKTSNEEKKRDAEVRILEGLVHAFSRTYQTVKEFVEYVTKLVKCSPNTLYRNKHLWQERLAGLLTNKNTVYLPQESPPNQEQYSQDNPAQSATEMVCNSPASKGLRAFSEAESQKAEMVCNSPASKGSSPISAYQEPEDEKQLKHITCVDLSWFLAAPPILRLFILSSRFRLFLQGSFSCLLSNLFFNEPKKNQQQTQENSQANNSLNQNSSNTQCHNVLYPQPNLSTKKTPSTTNFSTQESVTAETPEVNSSAQQPPVKAVNFEDWYQQAIAQGIVEDVPISWLPKTMGEYMVRLLQPDPLTGAPYTLVKWRELAFSPKPT